MTWKHFGRDLLITHQPTSAHQELCLQIRMPVGRDQFHF